MQRTIRLFDLDSYLQVFDATVIDCTPDGERFAVVLDRTAFFPEEGGQSADTGSLGNAQVLDVQEKEGVILHYTDKALEIGSCVHGQLDFALRYRKMQIHSGEHIVSGLMHRKYGFSNVGFHLGGEITMDFDGELTRAQLDEIEDEANRIIYENVAITAEYPSAEVLAATEYRSKLDLTENVRLVTIGEYDICACCAPHVSRTGEIGVIKLLDAIRYKGGMRIHFLAGSAALEHYRKTWSDVAILSSMMSVKQSEVVDGLKKKEAEIDKRGALFSSLRRQLLDFKIAALEQTDGNLCIFTDDPDMLSLRLLVNAGVEKCTGICAAFSGDDVQGYRYIMGSAAVDLKSASKQINAALGGKGGGTPQMIQGSCTAIEQTIRAYFES
jgi:alanyl-tRNA synthetase